VDGPALRAWCLARGLPAPPELAGAESVVVESLVSALHEAAARPSAAAFGKLGRICESQLAHDAAIEYFRRAAAADPADFRWPYYLGYIRQILGQADAALPLFASALRLNPSYPTIHARLGQLYLDLERDADAERHFRRYLELRPDDWFGHVGLGRLALRRKDADGALTHLLQAERMAPQDFQVQYNLGRAYRELGRIEEAERHLSLAGTLPRGAWFLARDPLEQELRSAAQSTDALVKELERLQASTDWPKLTQLAEQIVERRPDDVMTLANLASLYRKQGRFADAHTVLRRAAGRAPGSARVAAVQAEIYLAENRHEEALAAADRALRLDSDHPLGHAIRGRALLLLNRIQESEAAMREAVLRRPHDASDWYVLGEVLRVQGRSQEAADSYRKALALRPDYAPARQRLGENP
jgi:tetratricopeptide (TPR) repeat protein